MKEFKDGTFGLRCGIIPIRLGGYLLPWCKDMKRISNRDIDELSMESLDLEYKALKRAQAEYERLRAHGLATISIPKNHGATTWEEWYQARCKKIYERITA